MALKKGYSRAVFDSNMVELLNAGYSRALAYKKALNAGRISFFERHPDGYPPYHLRTSAEKNRTGKASGYKSNPVDESRMAEAAQLYRDFSGHEAEVTGEVEFPDNPKVALAIGDCLMIGYETVRDGKVERYLHRFKKSARPLLVTGFDGQQLYLIGGSFTFTDRGITDN